MGRSSSFACWRSSRISGSVAVWLLCGALFASGCAILIPPSWRGHAPLPLAGPIAPEELDRTGGDPLPHADEQRLSDEQLRAQVEADRLRLTEIASRPDAGPLSSDASEAELREIAARLPRLQRELKRRGSQAPGSRHRHPVIR